MILVTVICVLGFVIALTNYIIYRMERSERIGLDTDAANIASVVFTAWEVCLAFVVYYRLINP